MIQRRNGRRPTMLPLAEQALQLLPRPLPLLWRRPPKQLSLGGLFRGLRRLEPHNLSRRSLGRSLYRLSRAQ